MAFLSDSMTDVEEMHEKMRRITNVAIYRDQVFAENTDKPIKIAIAAVVWGWVIYYFLIKR
jgi:hypothetical protein